MKNMNYSSNPDEITRDYFDSLLLETRYLDSVKPSAKMQLWGHSFDTPIMTAALSHLDNTTPDGMCIYAEAAARCNALHWVGMGTDEELERIVATGAKTVKIIKPHADDAEVHRKIEHAVRVGCIAVGMDIDHAFNSAGGYDNVFGLEMRPKTTEQMREYVRVAGVPFIVKGVLSVRDAVKCAEAGCAGIVLSHHHGMMPYSVPPLLMIDDIIDAVGGRLSVFVDCGIESGMDAYKCLAKGAKAVSVGRHLMPLLKNGAMAVADRIMQMTDELAGAMARTGVADLDSVDRSVLHKRMF